MTNDELDAVRARASRARRLSATGTTEDITTDVIALLDEVERLREGHEIVARIWKILGSPTFEELRGDTIYDVIEKRLSCATRAEAHAERLAGALEEVAQHLGGFIPEELEPEEHEILDAIAEALSAYRSEKDEACSRPSDALDAPVADQSTTCSQPERKA